MRNEQLKLFRFMIIKLSKLTNSSRRVKQFLLNGTIALKNAFWGQKKPRMKILSAQHRRVTDVVKTSPVSKKQSFSVWYAA